ncbi:MAG: hypothetical protein ACQEXJ_23245 [Myxococcota bacterium]
MKHRRTLTLAIALLATAATAATASARAPEAVPEAQKQLRTAMDRPDFDVRSERVVFTERGRRDLVLFANASEGHVVGELQSAYRSGRTLEEGYRVIGYAHVVPTDTWTFTLARGDRHFVVEVGSQGRGSRIALWGVSHPGRAVPRPERVLPPPRVPLSDGEHVRR